ncbi:MAG: class I SAM-dependent methyltransferase, partial [Deltaproteobacteria bacterium]|nr:class I SAM-dependent methyltransferase [Nannocystaceae bacterium]
GCDATTATTAPSDPVASPIAASAEELPQPVAVRINRPYAKSDAAKWVPSFEREGREAFDRRKDILSVVAAAPGMAVADVGAGTGLFTMEFARVVGGEGIVYAVDPERDFLAHIEARAKTAELANVRTVQADQRASGLAPGSIDLAFMCDAYHHLELPRTYLADLHAALRERGRLVVVDYDRTRKHATAWMREHIRADPAEFRAEIEAAGFVLVSAPALLEENFVMVFERR